MQAIAELPLGGVLAEMRRPSDLVTITAFVPADSQLREGVITQKTEVLSQPLLTNLDAIDVALGIIDLTGGVVEAQQNHMLKRASFSLFDDGSKATTGVKLEWLWTRIGGRQVETVNCRIKRGMGLTETVSTHTRYDTGAWGVRNGQLVDYRAHYRGTVDPRTIYHMSEVEEAGKVYSLVLDRSIPVYQFSAESIRTFGPGGEPGFDRNLARNAQKGEVQELKDFYQRLFQHAVDASSVSNRYVGTGA